MIVCVLSPRFALVTAAGDRAELLGHPLALAPEPGGVQQVGDVSLAAEAFGIHPGMRLGEALSRCPELTLIAPDPAGVEDLWERWLVRLESIGAGVAPERPGLVCFDARGLLALHGGLDGVLRAARAALRAPVRLGVGPTRFVAVAAATRARARRPEIVGLPAAPGRAMGSPRAVSVDAAATSRSAALARDYLAPLPVTLLRARPTLAALPEALERLGVTTLGELATLPAAAVADRFGRVGLRARDLARGGDDPLRPRVAGEVLRESLDLPDSALGAVILSATLVERGGTWRRQVVFREALADSVRMRLALIPRLSELPAPAQQLGLAVERFGPPGADQRSLLDDPAARRASRLREAVRQARATAGPEAALRVLEIDPGSRVPERRAVLAPFEA
jgi:protein ImuB